MSNKRFKFMYGYVYQKGAESTLEPTEAPLAKAEGEGSRGGKVIGHTRSGKPIYDSNNHDAHETYNANEMNDVEIRNRDHSRGLPEKRYPENFQALNPIPTVQQRKTHMPADGTSEGLYDPPGLGRYKKLIKLFKQNDLPFQGHITYNPKTDEISTLSHEAPKMIRSILAKLASKPESKGA